MNETETRWYRWIADHSQYFFWAVWGAVAGALAFPGIVVAQTTTVFMDGNALYGECADNRPVYQGKCGGFVVGVRDTLSTLEGTGVVRRTICMPKAVTQQQAIDVARQFLTAHPEVRHLSAASLVVGALQQSFPCTK